MCRCVSGALLRCMLKSAQLAAVLHAAKRKTLHLRTFGAATPRLRLHAVRLGMLLLALCRC